MFKNGIKLVAGILVTAIAVTSVPAEVFRATAEETYTYDVSVSFTAGAHHAIEDTIAITEKEEEYIVIAIENGEVPWVTQARIEEEEARIAEIQRQQREEANRKNYVAPTGGTGQDVVDYAV